MTTQTLTVSYETTQTIAFASNSSSVTGLSSVAITVSDGTNYYYYSPSEDVIGEQVDTVASSTYTWNTIYGLGDGDTSTSPSGASDGYIQSTGTQYIDTGVTPYSGIGTEMRFSDYTQNELENVLLGSFNNSFATLPYGFNNSPQNNKLIPYYNYDGVNTTQSVLSSGTLKLKNGVFYVNGTQVYTKTYSSFTSTITIAVFAGNFGNYSSTQYYGYKFKSKIKLYSLKIGDTNDDYIRNFIPIQIGDTSGEYALYDISFKDRNTDNSKVIYHNDGSNSFYGGGTRNALTYQHIIAPTVKVFNATSNTWVDGTPYVFNGTSWVQASKVYVYNGTSGTWVEKD